MLIRPPHLDEFPHLSTLCLRSKGYWGYDEVFLEACRPVLTLRPEDLTSSDIAVAEDSGSVIGLVQVTRDGRDAELAKLFVAPEAIGGGAGKALYLWALERSKALGARSLRIEADPGAAPFYQHMGAVLEGSAPSEAVPGRHLPLLRHRLDRDRPKTQGFRMPAEWEPHLRCWMMWPRREEVWPDLEKTYLDYARVAHAIAAFEPVVMAVHPEDMEIAKRHLDSSITLLAVPIDDSWARDAGPCFLLHGDGRRAGVDFNFNAWGGKYAPFDSDNAFAAAALREAGVERFASKLTAEGGGISVDGEGTALTTLSCFPNANRNPDWRLEEITSELEEMLGLDKVIWLPGDADELETDGHVDGIAVFCGPGRVLAETASQAGDDLAEVKQANLDALKAAQDAKGRPLEVLEMPAALSADCRGERFCNSYVNFYIANGGIVMPRYGVAEDDWAREILEDAFPGREVVMVAIDDVAVGGGGIHCITQQEPAPHSKV
ncbi:GNAT family N-acetyltransferase [Limibacillus halophilus]